MRDFIGKTKIRLKELKDKYGDEEVFAVPYQHTEGIKDGFQRFNSRKAQDIIRNTMAHGKFLLRAAVEEDMSFQQIIPYILICNEDASKFFVTRRIDGEKRLLGSLSLGIGGHLNPCDKGFMGDGFSTFMNGLKREENEETNVGEVSRDIHEPYGTVRDLGSSTPDHIGFVYLHHVHNTEKVEVREKDTLEPLWMTKEELVRNYEKFESWAQLIIADLVLTKKSVA